MKTSEECIAVLKKMEGFISKPMADNGQYSVGYGSGCNKNDYPNGITEEEADALLRTYLANMEKSVNYFITRYNLTLSQHQFDALMLFTYNVGANWINADGEFRQAVISGKTGNDLIFPMTLWSNASSKLNINLVKRRLAEANLYLNGVYSSSAPSNYAYVLYKNNGGVGDVSVQGYDASRTASPKPIPVLSGYRFMGWYTAKEGGSWVTTLDSSVSGKTLYAHWQKGSGDAVKGTPVSYSVPTSRVSSLDIYKAASSSEVTGTLDVNSTVQIVADYVDGANVKWGKLKEGGWVNLGNSLIGIVTTHEAQDPVTVTVTNSYINVRSGPNTTYSKVGTVYSGDELEIVETRLVGSDKWGRFNGGWISLKYTDYESVLADKDADTTTVTATGTVVNCSSLRIRSGAGTSYPVLGSLSAGTRVEITQQKTANGMTWGRISTGWISLSYVSLDTQNNQTDKVESSENSDSAKLTVTVTNSYINVRSGPNTSYTKVGTVYYGQQLALTEVKQMGQDMWGKFSGGWVSLMYTNYDTVVKNSNTATPDKEESGTDTPSTGTTGQLTGTVISNIPLNIRSAPGAQNTRVGTYATGTRLVILEQKQYNGDAWGRTDKGWVCMQYVQLDSTGSESTTDGVMGTVISNSPLNIRTGAGTHNTQIGTYNSGTRVTIYQQTSVNGQLWGKTDKGWVCMTYVQLDAGASAPAPKEPETDVENEPEEEPESGTATEPDSGTTENTGGTTDGAVNGTVTSYNPLNIRSAPGSFNTQVGTYTRGTRITIYEQKVFNEQTWGRTDDGWVCMSYVQVDPELPASSFSGVVNTDELRIRSAAGIHNKILGYYNTGDKVEILESVYVVGVAWGRTDKGWICLDYVDKV